jgi:hypothetical protein
MKKPRKNKLLQYLKQRTRETQGPVPPSRIEKSKRTYDRKLKHKDKERE